VELQRKGIVRIFGPASNKSAEYGLHFCKGSETSEFQLRKVLTIGNHNSVNWKAAVLPRICRLVLFFHSMEALTLYFS
jgi:hypothetical protein